MCIDNEIRDAIGLLSIVLFSDNECPKTANVLYMAAIGLRKVET